MINRSHDHRTVLDAIANWVKKYREAIGLRNELANCTPEQVALIARDMGLSPGELLSVIAKGPHAADELPKLLRALGVGSAEACVRRSCHNTRLATHLRDLRPQRSVPARSRHGYSREPLSRLLSECDFA
jgi:hypothetical protein